MVKDRWTVVLVRGEDGPLRQLSFTPRSIRFAVAGIGAFLVSLVAVSVFLSSGGVARLHALHLTRQNEVMTQELADVRVQVAALEGTVDALVQKGAEVRTLAGLESIDEEVLQAGVGGPGSATLDAHPLWDFDSVQSKEAFAVSYDLAALERRTDLLAASLSEASDSLLAHQELLESTPSILPTTGVLSSGFSKSRLHPIHHKPLPHEGMDVAAPEGTPILAAASGRVSFVGSRTGYGLTVQLDHGFGYETLYGHAMKILVRKDQEVERGEVVALVGDTGWTTSSHLHYEVHVQGKPVNPVGFVIAGSVP